MKNPLVVTAFAALSGLLMAGTSGTALAFDLTCTGTGGFEKNSLHLSFEDTGAADLWGTVSFFEQGEKIFEDDHAVFDDLRTVPATFNRQDTRSQVVCLIEITDDRSRAEASLLIPGGERSPFGSYDCHP